MTKSKKIIDLTLKKLPISFSDEEFIIIFYQTRGENVSDKRVLPRFMSERNEALKRLKDENK